MNKKLKRDKGLVKAAFERGQMSAPIVEIEVFENGGFTIGNVYRFYARVKKHPQMWDAGSTEAEALGKLVLSRPEVFRVNIKELPKQPYP